MNKSQKIEILNYLDHRHMMNATDDLEIILSLLNRSPLLKEYKALENIQSHIRGILSLECEKRNAVQRQLSEVYGD